VDELRRHLTATIALVNADPELKAVVRAELWELLGTGPAKPAGRRETLPAHVRVAEADDVRRFFDQCCEEAESTTDLRQRVNSGEFYRTYAKWSLHADPAGSHLANANEFGSLARSRFVFKKNGSVRSFCVIVRLPAEVAESPSAPAPGAAMAG